MMPRGAMDGTGDKAHGSEPAGWRREAGDWRNEGENVNHQTASVGPSVERSPGAVGVAAAGANDSIRRDVATECGRQGKDARDRGA